jgi:hypothetical protein
MNAVVNRGSSDSYPLFEFRPRVALVLALTLAVPAAWCFERDVSSLSPPSTVSSPDDGRRMQLELSTSSLPRFDNVDGSSRSSRIDMTWLPPRRSALGLSLGMTSSQGAAFPAPGPFVGAAPSVDLGLHWRYTSDTSYRIDVTAWRRLVPPDALTLVHTRQPGYGARVEMQLSTLPKSGFVADRGFVGLQLEGGARVTLRRSGGKPMIYYRTKF